MELRIAITFLMQSESEKWNIQLFPRRDGLMIIGAGKEYLQRGLFSYSARKKWSKTFLEHKYRGKPME